MTRINKELLKGSSDILVLAVLRSEPLYGYEIAKRIKAQSKEVLDMGEGTLYPILHKLEQDGMLRAFWEEASGRKRKYYQITRSGEKLITEKMAEWEQYSTAVGHVLKS